MALSESAVSDLLDALRVGEGSDLVRELALWALQQLIEAEASEKIGAGRYERTDGRVTERNGTRPKVPPRPATWPWRSRSSARAASSPSCSSPAGASTRPCTQW